MSSLQNSKIVIVGLGLIGGSIARSLALSAPDCEIIAVGRNEPALQQALADGSITGYATDLQIGCQDADLIILGMPVLAIEACLRELQPVLNPHTVITDVASVKQAVVDSAVSVFGQVPDNFVPGHPIAGSERSGYAASSASLFAGRKTILTPMANTSPEALALVTQLWTLVGAEVVKMRVGYHDEVLAATSHLPHLLAFALVDTLSQQGESEEIYRYAAGGFRDFTRIASSDPVMWRDIFVTNGDATAKVLDRYIAELQGLRSSLLARDADTLFAMCQRAKASRARFLELLNAVPTAPASD